MSAPSSTTTRATPLPPERSSRIASQFPPPSTRNQVKENRKVKLFSLSGISHSFCCSPFFALSSLFPSPSAMNSTRIAAAMTPNSFSFSHILFKHSNPPPVFLNFSQHIKREPTNSTALRVSNCLNLRAQEPRDSPSAPISKSGVVSLRLQRLASEFRSLPEPIDRVKRLLDYASLLTQLTESTRSPENRIPGCAAQVWLEVEIDEHGRVRFGADSDSEITKGFCSCLIYLLGGASPDEVLMVKAEDLTDMNVGLPVRSRVNSWHNVLIGMQDRTRSLMVEREKVALSSMVISPEGCYC